MIFCIGNFDGVHPGHAWAIKQARAIGGDVSVLTFDPHPRQYFDPQAAPFALTSAQQRERYLKALGVFEVICLPFDADLAGLSAQDFANRVLKDQLKATAIVAGQDFHFGKDRGGNMALLADLGQQLGFAVHSIDLQAAGGKTVSSSRIRQALRDGDYAGACDLWQQRFVVQGTVLQGDQLGRTLGFPTANLDFGAYLRPAFGVYASWVSLPNGQTRAGVTNIGRRPTVDGIQDRFETHIFDFDADLYGQTLAVELTHFIRPEQRFDGLDALKSQIAVDCETARSMLVKI